MAQKCNLCNLEFNNDEQFKQHVDGKKHKKLESIKQEREQTAQRSIFVSNLKKDTFQKHLEEHFASFGKITKVVIDQEKNAYAIIEFESEQSAKNAVSYPDEHRVNDKNVKVTRREVKKFVSKLPNSGDKKKEALEKLKEEALTVNKLLGKCETFVEQVDTLIEYLKLDEEHSKLRHSICDSLKRILTNYWSETEFEVSIFGSTASGLACNGSDMDMTVLFKDYLPENAHKQQKLPNIKPNNLKQQASNGQDSSDSNIAEIELDEEVNLEDTDEHVTDKSLKASLHQFFTEKNNKQFLKFELEHQIKIMARVFQRFIMDAKSLRTVTNARCPVVRFLHGKAKIYCDVSLNNYLANENTKLIELYINLEPNLKRMVYIIRYWMKHKNLYSSSRFNSYTIIWLIIFYLQRKNIGYLPTVCSLTKMTDQINEIHGWNCAFETNISKIKSFKPNNENQLVDINDFNGLLKGFFEFYSSFEYSPSKIITTNDALVTDINKTDLAKLSELNIQDPFDLSHNLTANISKSTLEHFVSECKASNELLQYSKSPRKSLNKCWGLILLMTKKALTPPTKPSLITPKELVEKSMFKLKLFDDSTINSNTDTNNNQELTVRKAIEFVVFLFKDCLLFEQLSNEQLVVNKRKRFKMLNQICDQVDLLGLNCSPKRLKIANNTSEDPAKPTNTYVCVMDENINNNSSNITDEDENQKTVSSFLFTVKYNTWQGRRNIKRELKQNLKDKNVSEIEIEKMVSKKLIETSKSDTNSTSFRIKFSVDSKAFNQMPGAVNYADLQIKFDMLDETENQNDLINFTTLVHFLDVYINNCHEKLFNQWIQNNSNMISE